MAISWMVLLTEEAQQAEKTVITIGVSRQKRSYPLARRPYIRLKAPQMNEEFYGLSQK